MDGTDRKRRAAAERSTARGMLRHGQGSRDSCGMRICFFGDSFVNGTGDDYGLGWVGRVAVQARRARCDITVYNLGVRLDTSDHIAARWEDEAARRLPRGCDPRLVFSFGANDCAPDGAGVVRVSPDRAIANAEAILQRAIEIAPTLMVGPIPVLDDAPTDRRIRDLSAAQEQVCARLAVPFLNVFAFVAGCEPWRREAASGDGSHPNREGYAALAEFIGAWPVLRAWLGPPEKAP
jgi:acyl-CoA thioesterase I